MGKKLNTYQNTPNHCDRYLLLLIASLAFGAIGGALTIVRAAAIILLPSFLNRYAYLRNYLKPFLLVFCIFYTYCLISLAWTPDKIEAGKELIYYPIHFLLFLEILTFARFAQRPLTSIALGWLVAVALTLPVATWEFISDHHLSTSKYGYDGIRLGHLEGETLQRHFAAATFTNLNSYVTILCFSMPFLIYGFMQSSGKHVLRMLLVPVILMAIICILFNASRGGFITIALMSIIYVVMTGKKKRTMWLLVLAALVAIFVINFAESMLTFIRFRANSNNILQGESRYVIWGNAWKAFAQTYGLGVGIGGMNAAMRSVTKGITITHNMFFEILLQYGIVFFTIFIYYIISLFRKALNTPKREVKTLLMMALLPMPVYLIINSGYLLESAVFALFASITVFADYEHTELLRKALRKVI